MSFNVTLELDAYKICHASWSRSQSDYGPKTSYVTLLRKGVEVGLIGFYPDTQSTVPRDYVINRSKIFLHYHERHFANVVATLRLEKPLYVYLRCDQDATESSGKVSGTGYLATYEEPTGEEESG